MKEMVIYIGGGTTDLEKPPLVLSENEQPLANAVCELLMQGLNLLPQNQDEVDLTIPKELGVLPDEEVGFTRLMTFIEDWAYQNGWAVGTASNFFRKISLHRLPASPYQQLPR